MGPGEYKLGPSSPAGGEVRDKLLDVDKAIEGRLPEWETLIEQAVNNTKEQFGNSPDLDARILDAVMDALSAFTAMSRQALESERIRAEIKAILLGPGRLYELLRAARGERGDGE